MNARNFILPISILSAVFLAAGVGFSDRGDPGKGGTKEKKPAAATERTKVVKSEQEWKKLLTEEQFRITRKAGTERSFGKGYELFKKQGEGVYYCVCCGTELFSSNEKFNSGCGWPSFYDPSRPNNVAEKKDMKYGMERTEVVCAVCDAHLGHVFSGEGFATPTDKRYCINMAALKFGEAGAGNPVKESEEGKEKAAGDESADAEG